MSEMLTAVAGLAALGLLRRSVVVKARRAAAAEARLVRAFRTRALDLYVADPPYLSRLVDMHDRRAVS